MRVRTFAGLPALLVGLSFVGAAECQPAVAETYQVDPVHSSFVFRVKHFNVGYIHGRFNDVSGTVTFDPDKPEAASFDIQVKAASIDSNNPKRDQHLRGPDFFNVKEFPTIAFKSKEVKPLGDKMYEVTGDLTLHGVTQPVTAKVEYVGAGKDPRGTQRAGFEATFTVRRSEFGMKGMLGGIGDEVRVTAAFEGVK
jgi:polyisoprenoid-binding protein YceI